ncbi:outer membrane beta-barrel protein [Sulfurimonas aquatica]|uniref:Outer membrane beta-barrel protein n=1 Tax=Sulfurimonas aquatica TaxID=2672570 RepID=A0A975AYJ4_9BACT|nr:outer membrane beta-barrel protein [Sulfurimonas aquatica]QSZ40845.1 outer membrane beta-barrel protein [Sulfurimonas aquatica]
MKIYILLLLLLSSLYAESKVYVGTSLAYINESFNDIDANNASPLAKVKLAYGDRTKYAVELSLEYTKNDSKIFSSSNTIDSDGDKMGFNIEFLKAFNNDMFFLPFFKVGFGSGSLDITRVLQDSLNYGSFNLGAGVFLPINEHFDFELGYEFKYLSYEAVDTIAQKNIHKSNINAAYFGFNVRF